jgi:hypothetical protein
LVFPREPPPSHIPLDAQAHTLDNTHTHRTLDRTPRHSCTTSSMRTPLIRLLYSIALRIMRFPKKTVKSHVLKRDHVLPNPRRRRNLAFKIAVSKCFALPILNAFDAYCNMMYVFSIPTLFVSNLMAYNGVPFSLPPWATPYPVFLPPHEVANEPPAIYGIAYDLNTRNVQDALPDGRAVWPCAYIMAHLSASRV